MSKTLTITVENIPEHALSELWKDTIKDANDTMGFNPEETSEIKIDFAQLNERYPEEIPDMLAELLVAALGVYSIQYFEDHYNNEPDEASTLPTFKEHEKRED